MAVPISKAEARESRREAAPVAAVVLLLIVVLAVVSRANEWELLGGLPWWIWLLVALPALLLAIDLALTYRGKGIVRSRRRHFSSSDCSPSATSRQWWFSSPGL